MARRRQAVAFAVILLSIAWVIFPWVVPSYTHNLVMSVLFTPSEVPTYEVRLLDATLWPVAITYASWIVAQNGIYNYWVPSKPPVENLTLLPFQSYTFQFIIYNETDTTITKYYNGSLVVQLRATVQVLGSPPSPIRIQSWYNSTS